MTPYAQAVIGYPEYWGPTDKLWQYGYRNYGGEIVPWRKSSEELPHCKICIDGTDAEKCSIGELASGIDRYPEGGEADDYGYLMLSFATNFNTYYDRSCARVLSDLQSGNWIDLMPSRAKRLQRVHLSVLKTGTVETVVGMHGSLQSKEKMI